MANATDLQVQVFSDTQVRPSADAARAVALTFDNMIASIDDIYNALSVPSPTWTDSRLDGPPHLLSPSDILAFNSFMHNVRDAIKNDAQYPIVLKICSRGV